MKDPDRFLGFTTPGAQEWWYFDAVSDDGRDALVLIWYAGLPFDPDYGVATLRHLKSPARYPAPDPLDHCAVGVSWYHDGKTAAYALNGFRRADFTFCDNPSTVEVAGNRYARDADGYRLAIETPAVDGRTPIRAHIRFRPAPETTPLERDLGSPESPHVWVLAAADCRVEGQLSAGGRSVDFLGRGYHDHNAGSEEISLAMSRWTWGRVHRGTRTDVYYRAEPRSSPASSVWITCRDGHPETVREAARFEESAARGGNVLGVRHGRTLRVSDGETGLLDERARCVDDGPFYRRWLGPISPWGDPEPNRAAPGSGISELLDTRNLNRRLFNWMIPYRLKRPGHRGGVVS